MGNPIRRIDSLASRALLAMPSLQGEGRAPLTTACAPSFRFTQNTFLEHQVTTKQQATMEKGIITFKHNSR